MTERELLHLTREIVLLERRARLGGERQLTKALGVAAYFAGLRLGELSAEEGKCCALGETAKRNYGAE